MNITKGTWERIEGSVFAGKRRLFWGSCADVPLSEMEANLKLAAAAPEMYEALKAIVEQFSHVDKLYSRDKEIISNTEAILLKAEGKSK